MGKARVRKKEAYTAKFGNIFFWLRKEEFVIPEAINVRVKLNLDVYIVHSSKNECRISVNVLSEYAISIWTNCIIWQASSRKNTVYLFSHHLRQSNRSSESNAGTFVCSGR